MTITGTSAYVHLCMQLCTYPWARDAPVTFGPSRSQTEVRVQTEVWHWDDSILNGFTLEPMTDTGTPTAVNHKLFSLSLGSRCAT